MKIKIALIITICFTALSLIACGTDDPVVNTKKYVVTWKDSDNSILKTEELNENSIPNYTTDKEDTVEWDYSFAGWSDSVDSDVLETLPKLTTDVTYYAVYTKVKRKYTLTFDTNGGSLIDSITKEYSESVDEPSEPTLDGKIFVGWCSDIDLENEVIWPVVLNNDVTIYAKWNERALSGTKLKALLSGYKQDIFEYIPNTMKIDYQPNLLENNNELDYSSFVNINDIENQGIGEQWKMIQDNLDQTNVFMNTLALVDGIITSSVSIFNDYLDKNPQDTNNYEFASGIYNVTIKLDEENIYYVLDYTIDIPLLGEQSVQIVLDMNLTTNEKHVRIQLGEDNALTYTITNDSYTFAIKYAKIRSAYFSIEKDDDNNVAGHIYEHLGVGDKKLTSAADFYITDEYVSVVGNKAGGMIGFSGTITELYDVETGKMLGYEVNEKLSSLEYDTLWFDLSYVTGINNIKYTQGENPNFFINNSSTAFDYKIVGGLSGYMLSRRYDIEFRKQYFNVYNDETKTYETVVKEVPMLFVQEKYLSELSDDIKAVNGIDVNINLDTVHINKIMSDYSTLIEIFSQNKELVSLETINNFIGEKLVFN